MGEGEGRDGGVEPVEGIEEGVWREWGMSFIHIVQMDLSITQ